MTIIINQNKYLQPIKSVFIEIKCFVNIQYENINIVFQYILILYLCTKLKKNVMTNIFFHTIKISIKMI